MSADPITVSMPALYCPVVARRYPDAEEIGKESLAWLKSFGLRLPPGQWAEIEAERMGYWFALFTPGAASRERMRLGADMFASIFPYDDAYSGRFAIGTEADAVSWAGRWCRLLDDPQFAVHCDHPVTEAVADFLRRLAEECTDTQYRRFADPLKTYMWGIAWEFAGHDKAVRESLAEAVPCRIYSAGVLPTIGILHASHNLHITDEVFYRPAVRAFTEAASFLIGLHNDLFSYPKEALDAAEDVNLLAAVITEHHCSVAEGVAHLIRLSNQIMTRLVELRTTLARTADNDLLTYLDAALEMLAGHLEFEQHCIRYRRGTAQLPAITITSQPTADTPAEPPAVPTLTWWWHLPEPGRLFKTI